MGNTTAQEKCRPCSQTWHKDLHMRTYIYIYICDVYATAVGDTAKAYFFFCPGVLSKSTYLYRVHYIIIFMYCAQMNNG